MRDGKTDSRWSAQLKTTTRRARHLPYQQSALGSRQKRRGPVGPKRAEVGDRSCRSSEEFPRETRPSLVQPPSRAGFCARVRPIGSQPGREVELVREMAAHTPAPRPRAFLQAGRTDYARLTAGLLLRSPSSDRSRGPERREQRGDGAIRDPFSCAPPCAPAAPCASSCASFVGPGLPERRWNRPVSTWPDPA